MLRASLSSYPSCCCCCSSSSSYLSYNEPEPTISSSQKKKMAQPRNPNAPQQEQHNHQQNSTFLLDALYCEEEHSLDQESEEEEQSHYSNHNNNEDPSKKSNPDLPFLVEHDLIWEEEELRFLLSKEEEGNHVNVFGGIERNPSLVRARREGLEWMMKVSALYDFSAATPILAVNCLDRFFVSFFSSNRRQEKPWMTQLTAVACLSLAAKVEEIHVPLLLDLQVGDAKYVFEAKTIQRMEILVLSTLQWKMNPATPLSFVDYIVRRIGLKSEASSSFPKSPLSLSLSPFFSQRCRAVAHKLKVRQLPKSIWFIQIRDINLSSTLLLDDLDSRGTMSPDSVGVNKCGFSIVGSSRVGPATNTPSRSFKRGMRKGSEGLKSIGRSLGFGVSKAVFPEDLKVSEKKIFDPQDKFLQLWNKLCVISCILAVSVDPLFYYLPVINGKSRCLGIDRKLAITATTFRTIVDVFYLIHMALQFRTAYIAPSSRVFGRGELVIDPAKIAKRYLRGYFIIDFVAVLPLPQIVIWRFLQRSVGSDVQATKQALFFIVLLQYIPRFIRILPLTSELKRTSGVFAETAWAGAVYYLLLYMLASHMVGAFWYLLAVERNDSCWHDACRDSKKCIPSFLYCGNQNMKNYDAWGNISEVTLKSSCSADDDNPPFDYGIYKQAVSSGIVSSKKFISKYCYCLWWGLQNLSTLGQGLETSTYPGEVIFSIALAIFGLILFALLIGNMQTYLQSLTIRLEEMRVKRRDSEQWMHHRLLPQDLRERVRRYDQYKWLETRGVDEESLVQSLPKDLRRDIKRHLCLALVRRVPLFESMDERLLDAICERLKPSLFTESTYIVREGDPVDEMLFIIRGRLESVTTDGGRSGFFNRSLLKEGDFCGEELLTWALDPKSGSNLPSSTRTVRALTEVEAFALEAEELKFVASQFRRLHSRQVQHTFRFYSQQWRTWAACFIQAAWRRYSKRKTMELRQKEEEEEEAAASAEGLDEIGTSVGGGSYSLGATFLASRFAANALRGVHRYRNSKSARDLVKLQKPPEPDFSADATD